MPACPLPENSTLGDVAEQATFVRDLVRSGDSGALAMVDEFHPALSSDGLSEAGRFEEAHRLLVADPSVADRSLIAAVVVGDHRAVQRALAHDPGLTNAAFGPNGWQPLLYAAYSRISTNERHWSSVETIRTLIEHGADPTAARI